MKLFYLCVEATVTIDRPTTCLSHIREAFIDEDKAIRKCNDLLLLEEEKRNDDPDYEMKAWKVLQASIDDIDEIDMYEIWKQVDPYKKHRRPQPNKPIVVLRKTTPRILGR